MDKAAPTCVKCNHDATIRRWKGLCQWRASGDVVRERVCGCKCVFPAAPTDEAVCEHGKPPSEYCFDCVRTQHNEDMADGRFDEPEQAVKPPERIRLHSAADGSGWEECGYAGDSDHSAEYVRADLAAPTADPEDEKVAREIVKEVVWPTDRSLPSEHCACESSMCEHWQAELANLIVSALTAARGTAAGIKLAEAWEVRAKKLQSEFVDAHSREDGGSMLGAADALWACAKQLRVNGPAAERWRPIETAPKDQKYILGGWWYNSQMWVWDRCEYFEGWFCPNGGTPTHWMPLPSGPQANQEDNP